MEKISENINREDMLELTRRMTPARTSFTRIAGCYVDQEGDFDGSFNINFLKLSQKDKAKNLEIAKIDAENNLIGVKGAVPGPKGGIVTITDSVKA